MARNESDREDLMREATAFVRRAEMTCPGLAEGQLLFAGFREDGRFALYFGPDPVYQFDDQHRLRRAFLEGFLYRTQGDTLARLVRNRTDTETALLRHDLTADELDDFRNKAKARIATLLEAIRDGEVRIHKQIPGGGDFLEELRRELTEILNATLPLAPQIPGKS